MAKAARRGAVFYGISPLRDDMPEEAGGRVAADQGRHRRRADAGARAHAARRKSARPRLCRALLHRLRNLRTLSARPRRRYAKGRGMGGRHLPAFRPTTIVDLARRLPRGRTLITVSHSLQRAQYGEQPVWMGAVLAAMLGQIGLPGGGYNYALGALGHTGRRLNAVPIPTLPQGRNGVSDFIPVARIADMLLNPGEPFEYNGRSTAITPISSWSIGRAATRSIITRTSTGCGAPSMARRPSSCTRAPGRRWRSSPTSCCRRP